jgi:hypothetical protein
MARIVLDERPCNCNECPLSILTDCNCLPYKHYLQYQSWRPQKEFYCDFIITLDELKEVKGLEEAHD